MAAPRQQVRYRLQDREGNTSTVTFWVSPSLSFDELQAFVYSWANLINNLSDARIVEAKCIIEHKISNPPDAGMGSDVTTAAVFYYSNGDTYEAIYIPSPKEVIFEDEGGLAGMRINPLVPAVEAFINSLASLPFELTTPEGETFPPTFTVGGFVL